MIEEKLYDNTHASELLFQARTNTLRLSWRDALIHEDTNCPLCNKTIETLGNLLSCCPGLQDIRQNTLSVQSTYFPDFILLDKNRYSLHV